MNRRDLIKSGVNCAVATALWGSKPVRAMIGLPGGVANVSQLNPLGINLAAGGAGSLYFEGQPYFKNQVRQAKGFFVVGDNATYVARTAAGWPATDFDLHLFASAGLANSSWVGGTWSCGFIGSGSEILAPIGTGVTIPSGSIVHGSGGAYTTFQLVVPSGCVNFGYTVTNTTGGVTNVFAYMPAYNTLNTIDDMTNTNSVRTEVVNHLKPFSHLRAMWPTGVPFNSQKATAANRNTISNCQTNNGWVSLSLDLTAMPAVGDTSATLTTAWPNPTGIYGIRINASTVQWRLATLTNGATTCDWSAGGGALTAAATSTNVLYGMEGYPIEWWVTLANACNTGLYVNTPIFEDGANGSAGTWLAAVCDYIAAHYTGPGPIFFEIPGGNENWNNTYYGTHMLPVMWALYGFASLFDYYAYRMHQSATLMKAHFPSGWWLTKVFPVFAWQAAVPVNFADIMAGYSTYGTTNADLAYLASGLYSNPPIANTTDSVATIEADSLSDAQNLAQGSNTPGIEQITVTALHYGLQHMTYEQGFQWNGKSPTTSTFYSTFNNVGAAIMDPVGYPACIEAIGSTIFNGGVVLSTHYSDGVSTSTNNSAPTDELTTDDTNIDTSPTMVGLKTFFPPNAITITRNDITVPGTVIDGRNYTDSTTAAAFPKLNGGGLANPSAVPYGNAGSKGTVAYLLYSKVARTVALSVNFTGAGTTQLEYGSYPAGFTIVGAPTVFTIPSGTNNVSLGTFPVVKGWNYVLLGVPGTAQAGVTINSLTAG